MLRKFLLPLLLTVGMTACSASEETANLDAEAFAAAIQAEDVVVIDVRTPDEYAAGHLEDAQLIDLNSGTFETDISALDKSKTYALYCRSGNRSGQAMQLMEQAGFENVFHLSGGIIAWEQAGLPTGTS